MDDVTALRDALVNDAIWVNANTPKNVGEWRARLDALIAAARRATEGSGVVEALEAFMVAFEETGVHEHERDDDSIDLCIPIAPLKPVYWAACAAVGHRWTVVDVEPFCERCGFREGDDEDDATLTAVVQSAEHHPGDRAAVEEAGSSPARGAALPRPEEPRVDEGHEHRRSNAWRSINGLTPAPGASSPTVATEALEAISRMTLRPLPERHVVDPVAWYRHMLSSIGATADAALAALPRPDEPRVERCAWCGTPIAEHPLTDACAIAQESEAR